MTSTRVVVLLLVLAWAAPVFAKDAKKPSRTELSRARKAVLKALPQDPDRQLSGGDLEWQNREARERSKSLKLVDVTVRVQRSAGSRLGGVTVRALHPRFDVSGPAVETNPSGEAKVRLPRGEWRLDLSGGRPGSGRAVFARVLLRVAGPGLKVVDVPDVRLVKFKGVEGAYRPPDTVTLAVPDFSLHHKIEPRDGRFEILTVGDGPLVLQASRRPGAAPGYVLRRTLGPGDTEVATDGAGGTTFTFEGSAARKLLAEISSADALPYRLEFDARKARTVVFSGLKRSVLKLRVERSGAKYDFYPRPFELDGKPRTFTGKPPFDVTVGQQHHTEGPWHGLKGTLSFRVFLREANGLVVAGHRRRAPFQVTWKQSLRGKVRKSGTMSRWYLASSPKVKGYDVGSLRYELTVKGPGEDRTVEVGAHRQTERVQVGKVRIQSFPEIAGNVRMWAAAVNDAVRAYEDVCVTSRGRVDVTLFCRMPPGLGGFGGYAGNTGFAFLPEGPAFAFHGTYYWTGLHAHELGHVHNYWHGNADQRRRMQQAGRRAGRRYAAIRPGMERRPEGNRFLPLIDAVTRGKIHVEQDFADAGEVDLAKEGKEDRTPSEAAAEASHSAVGEDDVLVWYLRCTKGVAADRQRRNNRSVWGWWLVLQGCTDDEIEAAVFSHCAGESLAWLARIRGLGVLDHMVEGAMDELASPSGKLVGRAARDAAMRRWTGRALSKETDLQAVAVAVLGEVGSRPLRVSTLVEIAREHARRGDSEAVKKAVVAALREARKAEKETFTATLDECVALWAVASRKKPRKKK